MLQAVTNGLRKELSHRARPDIEATRKRTWEIVDGYFRTDRPILYKDLGQELLFGKIDNSMHDLLRLTQGESAIRDYKVRLQVAQNAAAEMELMAVAVHATLYDMEAERRLFSLPENRLLESLAQTKPEAAACYSQGLRDLRDKARTSWRGTATEFREALRGVLDHLAPDEAVKAAPGYMQDPNVNGPTMKQKANFILKSRRKASAKKTVQDAVEIVEDKVGAFVRTVYTQSSVSVHTDTARDEVLSIKRFAELALAELLEIPE
jgi:hypothetical protein